MERNEQVANRLTKTIQKQRVFPWLSTLALFALLLFFLNIYSQPPYVLPWVRSRDHLCVLISSRILLHPTFPSPLPAPSPQQQRSFSQVSNKNTTSLSLERSMATALSRPPPQANHWQESSQDPISFLPLLPFTLNPG